MRILHYTIGFEPVRTGGLVKYATDLIHQETDDGQEVSVLYPGTLNVFNRHTYIRFDGHHSQKKVRVYALINSLPLPLRGGIHDPKFFMKPVDKSVYERFLKEHQFDIIHMHSLMGINLEFLEAAKELGIPIVYTTHDYFGLSSEPNLFLNGKSYDNQDDLNFWGLVSEQAPSVIRDVINQLPFYTSLRHLGKIIFKAIHANMDGNSVAQSKESKNQLSSQRDFSQLKLLREYYEDMFRLVAYFHFNSIIAENVFWRNLPFKPNGGVDLISSKEIVNTQINIEKTVLKRHSVVAYVGPNAEYKGFKDFVQLSQDLQDSGLVFRTYGYTSAIHLKGIEEMGRYSRDQLRTVYSDISVLIVPSKWKETFGLIVVEALSYGVPVFVSSNVGAGQLVPPFYQFDNLMGLEEKLLNRVLPELSVSIPKFSDHVHDIEDIYRKMIYS